VLRLPLGECDVGSAGNGRRIAPLVVSDDQKHDRRLRTAAPRVEVCPHAIVILSHASVCLAACVSAFAVLPLAVGVAAAYREGPLPAMTGGFGSLMPSCRFDKPLNDPGGSPAVSGVPERYESGRVYDITVTLKRRRAGPVRNDRARGRRAARRSAGGRVARSGSAHADRLCAWPADS
jgi:hypothetical protein